MALWLDEEIDNPLWCLGATFRCTPSESIGIWSVILFYSTVVAVTAIHSFLNGTTAVGHRRPQSSGRRHRNPPVPDSPSIARSRGHHNSSGNGSFAAPIAASHDDDLKMLCLLLVYFSTFAAGCLVWVLGGARCVHPFQIWQIQLLGSTILMACSGLFVAVHFDLGKNWSPVPEKLVGHELVTTGLYGWARHPMYAVFLWAAIGTLLATMNWLVAWCVSGLVLITLRRIPVEERDMLQLFGRDYAQYRDLVPPLGFPFVGRRCWRPTSGLLDGESTYEVIQ